MRLLARLRAAGVVAVLAALPLPAAPPATGTPPIQLLDASGAAFVGSAPAGPFFQPVKVGSWDAFKLAFGGGLAGTTLPGAVHAFFQNGGRQAFVVRIPGAQDSEVERALATLNKVEGIGLVALPGRVDLPAQTALIRHCEAHRFRLALLDPRGAGDLQDQRSRLASPKGHAALFHPWLKVPDPATGATVRVPPSGAVAGVYARNDRERGIHMAPANLPVLGAAGLDRGTPPVPDAQLDLLGINQVRAFAGRGHLLWGAHTLARGGPEPVWGPVNLKRLVMNLEESLQRGTAWVAFEPQGEALWRRVTGAVDDLLTRLWRSGALLGRSPREAFFVRCDRSTMTQADLDAGRLVCLVGVAPVRPAEFVILRIVHTARKS